MSSNLLPALMCIGFVFVAAVAYLLVKGASAKDDKTPAQTLLEDVQTVKAGLIAEAMKIDRDKAFVDYLQTKVDAVPIIRKEGA